MGKLSVKSVFGSRSRRDTSIFFKLLERVSSKRLRGTFKKFSGAQLMRVPLNFRNVVGREGGMVMMGESDELTRSGLGRWSSSVSSSRGSCFGMEPIHERYDESTLIASKFRAVRHGGRSDGWLHSKMDTKGSAGEHIARSLRLLRVRGSEANPRLLGRAAG